MSWLVLHTYIVFVIAAAGEGNFAITTLALATLTGRGGE